MTMKEKQTKTDLEQMVDFLYRAICSKEKSNKELLARVTRVKNDVDKLVKDAPLSVETAQRNFRSAKYAYTQWARCMLTSDRHNILPVLLALSPGAHEAMNVLQRYAYEDSGQVTISKKDLGILLGKSTKSATAYLKELTDLGILVVTEQATDRVPATYAFSPLYLQTGKVQPQSWLDYEYKKALRNEQQAKLLFKNPPCKTAKKRLADGTWSTVLTPINDDADDD